MAEQKRIPKREEVEKQYTWATEDLFATDELWYKELESCKSLPVDVQSFRGRLGESASVMFGYLKFFDNTRLRLERLANYAMRKSDEDTGNSKYQDMRGKIISLYVAVQSAGAFVVPEIIAISDETLDSFMETEPELRVYDRYFKMIRRKKAHTLSDIEEKLLASAQEMAGAPDQIGSTFRNADLRFPDVVDSEGNAHPLTQGSFIPMMENPDRALRKKAFETFYSVFKGYKNTVAAFIDAQVKQLSFYSKARKYNSNLEAALDETEVPVTVYTNLIDAVNDNLAYLQKYITLRKKLMGLDELHMYDLYTPIVGDYDEKIPYEQAKKNVLEALAPLGENYLSILRGGFENRWIDVYENEGKRSGAYSSAGDPHPFVLLNHKDTLDSEFTLAHEMGHSLHTYFSIQNQPTVYNDYVIFVAEVASTVNEVLLMKHLLSKATDKKQKAYLLNHFLEQFRGTVYRQTMFAEFELAMSQMSEKGDSLTADALCKTYYDLNCKYFGNDIVIDEEISYEWERIPHFFYNFYVFQYATGFSAAVAIANKILTEGQQAVDAYIKFLSSGGSADPISLLKIAGVDMTTAQPVKDALKLFDELLDEMDELMK